jgi:hypothetical protein
VRLPCPSPLLWDDVRNPPRPARVRTRAPKEAAHG